MGMYLVMIMTYLTDYDLAVVAVMNAIKEFPKLDGVKKVLVYDAKGYASDDASLLVKSCIADYLKSKGIEVYYQTTGVTPDMEIRYVVQDLKVVYTREFRKFLIGEKMVERWAHAQMEVSLIKNDKLIGVYRLSGDARSIVPKKAVIILRSASFTQDYSTQRSGDSLVEPLLITAIIGVLIYIFYVPK